MGWGQAMEMMAAIVAPSNMLQALSVDVVEQRQALHLGIGLEGRLQADVGVLEVGDALEHVQVFGARAVGLQLDGTAFLVARDAVGAVEQLAGVAADIAQALDAGVLTRDLVAEGAVSTSEAGAWVATRVRETR